MAKKVFLSKSIFTSDNDAPVSGAIVVNGDLIEYVGTAEDAPYTDEDEVIDLGSKTITPGLIDCHVHAYPGIKMEQNNACFLNPMYSRDELIDTMRTFIAENPEPVNGIYYFFDYDFSQSGMLMRYEMDELFGDAAIMLTDISLHGGTFTTKALEVLQFDFEAPLPEGSVVHYEEDGTPGYFVEGVYFMLHIRAMTMGGEKNADQTIDEIQRRFNAQGFTAIAEMRPMGNIKDYVWAEERYLQREAEGSLTLRVGACSSLTSDRKYWEEDIRRLKGDFVFFNALKGFMDGGFINSTAWTTAEYIAGPNEGQHPGPANDMELYAAKIKEANDLGIGVRVHAEGDLAIEKALEMYAQSDNMEVLNQIEHCTAMTPRTEQKIKEYVASGRKLAINFQPIFLYAEAPTEEHPVDCGNEFYDACAVRVNSAIKTGAIVSVGSTDFPVVQPSASRHIRVAVNRLADEEGSVFYGDGYTPDEAITLPQAIIGNTRNAAIAIGRGHDLGIIRPGYKADFTVFNADIFEMDRPEYRNIDIYKTIVGGKEVYSAKE